MKTPPSHVSAVMQAVLVTFLWSTSWVLIKFGLEDIPAVSFAALRYGLASICLLALLLRPSRLAVLRRLPRRLWTRLIVLGLLYYAMAQGAQYVALALLPAITTNLVISFTTIAVVLLGIIFLGEHPHPLQWAGIALYLLGVIVYFSQNGEQAPGIVLAGSTLIGFVVAVIGALSNAGAVVLARDLNRSGSADPLTLTAVSMGIGAAVMLGGGLLAEGLPRLTLLHWGVIAWLALINTAFAFTLWNHTLRTLSAMEGSIINSLMMVFIPILAWSFLGERPGPQAMLGLVLAGLGILIVQLRRRPLAVPEPLPEEAG